jgi:two-component system chemotaxis response regulator CheB
MDHFKVLVIDDSLMIRAMIEQIVSRDPEFHVVGVASDVPEAREVIETKHPNLITLDLMMPGIGGLDFLDELAGHPHAPVVVVSSSTKDGSPATDEALAHGAEACFDKAKVVADAAGFAKLLKKVARRRLRYVRLGQPAVSEPTPTE